MDVHITLKGRGDFTTRIYRQLFDAVLDGRLRQGERLPPTRELARHLAVSRNTVALAYERLVAEGVLLSRVGSGTFVRPSRSATFRRGARLRVAACAPESLWKAIPELEPARSIKPLYNFESGGQMRKCFRSRRGADSWLVSFDSPLWPGDSTVNRAVTRGYVRRLRVMLGSPGPFGQVRMT